MRKTFALFGILFIIFLIGCTRIETPDGEPREEQVRPLNEHMWTYDGEPVTLKFLSRVDEETFQKQYKEKVEAQFPNITLQLIQCDGMECVDGVVPDIYMGRPFAVLDESTDYFEPLNAFIGKTNFNLKFYWGNIIRNEQERDPLRKNELYGLPLENPVLALFYNKDIFDLFGEPYPGDDMTWEEIISLTRKLTHERNKTEYRGLGVFHPAELPFSQLNITGTDPEGNLLFAQDPNTKKLFDLLDEYRKIPNILGDEDSNDGFEHDAQNIAMVLREYSWIELLEREEHFNFGVVTAPTWGNLPYYENPEDGPVSLSIPRQSENKEAAWRVIAYLATETLPGYSKYDDRFIWFMRDKIIDFLHTDKDVVTYIREIGEEYGEIVYDMKERDSHW